MLKSHEKFYSENGRRLVLIATNEPAARAHFQEILKEDYLLLFAENEQEAWKLIRENGDILSLIILQLSQPDGVCRKMLALIQEEPELRHIPVTVAHEDPEVEVEVLSGGAIDFIPVPYPSAGVILARTQRTIELSEDRSIISSTERDPLTGLYNREYFYRYADQYDNHHKTKSMDAIVIDVNNFRTINERFGTDYGDAVLRRIGQRVRDMVKDSGGIVCRRDADTFQVYCPHRSDYQAILEDASEGLAGEKVISDRVRLRMGVYENVDKTIDIERRFDRASMAADSVRSSFAGAIGSYDSVLHERELEDARLVEEFQTALRERQFQVFYQPKFDVAGEKPVLLSAEALVRWNHPVRGTILPSRFIPLFEHNGLIQPLDHYVWEETARQIRDWRDRLGVSVPVSVNMSRINMYDPNMIQFLTETLQKYGLEPSDMHLEITETAYTADSSQVIRKVEKLRNLGFLIEMDDFGTGYSSLNMIATLPIDALKLDRDFIQMIFRGEKNIRMMEIMLDIADYLNVPIVAEGVETEEQLKTLRSMGCHIIQGYYFSRPVPAEEFEAFLRY